MMRDLGIEFQRQGYEVTILTPSDAVLPTREITMEDNVRVVRVRTAKIKGTPNTLRALREAGLSATLWRRAKDFFLANKVDLILIYSPTIFWGTLARRLKSLWNCPAYLILRDIFPQWAVDAGILRKGLVWRYFRKKEMDLYELAECIGVESPANLKYFAQTFPHRQYGLEVLYNWTRDAERPPVSDRYRKALGLQDAILFLYGGNLGLVQDLDNLVRLAKRVAPYKKIHFLLVGDGSEAARIDRAIADNGLSNINVLPALPHGEYAALLSEADVGLVSLDRRLKTHNVPGKLLGYVTAGKPVLASVNAGNDLFPMLESHKAGLCVLNGEDDALADAALALANDPQLRLAMGENSRSLLDRFFSVRTAALQIASRFPAPVVAKRMPRVESANPAPFQEVIS